MKLYLSFLFFLLSFISFSQQTLRGKVSNTHTEPLDGVYVYNLASKSHAHTSENGLFLLDNTKVGDSIEIGLLGYETLKMVTTQESFSSLLELTLNEKYFQLDELVLTKELNPVSTIARLDLSVSPVNSSQEILRKVPGLIIGQHAGGGKAEQIFLRGFDIDHGTDISLSVDGMPVNMVSHAHGQGYSDLHFLISEAIETIDF